MHAPVLATLGAACSSDWLHDTLLHSLSTGHIHPALHYITNAQAAAWMRVHQRHTPAGLADFYRTALPALVSKLPELPAAILSHGCGTGWKDVLVAEALAHTGKHPPALLAADISPALVAHTLRAWLARFPTSPARGYVGDIHTEQQHLRASLNALMTPVRGPVLHHFFGTSPNTPPETLRDTLSSALQPGDYALISFNTTTGSDLAQIATQYDNAETRAWLGLLPTLFSIPCTRQALEFMTKASTCEAVPHRFVFTLPITSGSCATLEDGRQILLTASALNLFTTYRYTPSQIEAFSQPCCLKIIAQYNDTQMRETLAIFAKDSNNKQ